MTSASVSSSSLSDLQNFLSFSSCSGENLLIEDATLEQSGNAIFSAVLVNSLKNIQSNTSIWLFCFQHSFDHYVEIFRRFQFTMPHKNKTVTNSSSTLPLPLHVIDALRNNEKILSQTTASASAATASEEASSLQSIESAADRIFGLPCAPLREWSSAVDTISKKHRGSAIVFIDDLTTLFSLSSNPLQILNEIVLLLSCCFSVTCLFSSSSSLCPFFTQISLSFSHILTILPLQSGTSKEISGKLALCKRKIMNTTKQDKIMNETKKNNTEKSGGIGAFSVDNQSSVEQQQTKAVRTAFVEYKSSQFQVHSSGIKIFSQGTLGLE